LDGLLHADGGPKTRVGRAIAGVEKWVIVAIVFVMALLPTLKAATRAVANATLRLGASAQSAGAAPSFLQRVHDVASEGIPGSAEYAQHLTLWIGILGAVLATRSRRHLSLATGELIPAGPLRRGAGLLVNALSAGVCALLAYASWDFVQLAIRPITTPLPGGIPQWWSAAILPVGLAIVALRFAWLTTENQIGRGLALAIVVALFALELSSEPRIAALRETLVGRLADHADALVWPGIAAILVSVLLGTPVFVAMGGIAMLLFFADGTRISSVPNATYDLVLNPTLPAIPLLTAAGYILAEGGASKRLLRLARALVGWLPGGMALMVCFVCAGFTTFTGGSGVTILALGGIMLPLLLAEGYPEGFSLGLVTASGSLGLLFPPSPPVILYAVIAKSSDKDLYIAGFLPCLLLVLLVALYGLGTGIWNRTARTRFSLSETARAFWAAKLEVAIPVIVITLFFTGMGTMVEVAAIAVVLAVVSQSFVFRELRPTKELPVVLESAATLIGAVVILLGLAMGLTNWLVQNDVPTAMLEWTQTHIHSQVVFLLVLNLALLVLGSVLEIYSAIVILAPLLAKLGEGYGVDPLHMGIIFLANLELGFLFPPMGLNLILSSSRFGKPLGRLYRVAFPFLVIMSAGVLLVTYVPAMTNGFLELVKGKPAQEAPADPGPRPK
jgi:tripartite ATP-independent transporter DctM subunit